MYTFKYIIFKTWLYDQSMIYLKTYILKLKQTFTVLRSFQLITRNYINVKLIKL